MGIESSVSFQGAPDRALDLVSNKADLPFNELGVSIYLCKTAQHIKLEFRYMYECGFDHVRQRSNTVYFYIKHINCTLTPYITCIYNTFIYLFIIILFYRHVFPTV